MNPSSQILNNLQAENLLEGSHILDQIVKLRDGLQYNSDGQSVGFNEFFRMMAEEISSLHRLTLDSTVTPGGESQYQIQLVTALEKVFDEADRTYNRILFFQSKIRAALQQANALQVSFTALYTLAAQEALDQNKSKLPAGVIKALGETEFGRLMGGVNLDLETLMEATKVMGKQVQSHKTLAQEKYNLGKDQVNAAWTSLNLPSEGLANSDGASALLQEHEEEEDNTAVPVFVSAEPRLGSKRPEAEPVYTDGPCVTAARCYSFDGNCTNSNVCQEMNECMATPKIEIPETEEAAGMAELGVQGLAAAEASAEDVAAMFGDDAAVVETPVKAPAPRKVKTALIFRVPGDGQPTVERVKEGQPEKIKCVVCDRRIRVTQTMIERDGGWQHAVQAECIDAPVNARTIPTVPNVIPFETVPETENKDSEIRGVFHKTGDPAPVRTIPQAEPNITIDFAAVAEAVNTPDEIDETPAATPESILAQMENTAAIVTSPRKKLTMVSGDEEII